MIQLLWKTVWRFLKKLGIKPSYDPAILLLGVYPEETKIEKDTCTLMFIAALFTIARTWKQSRYPLTDEWIKKWYVYTMEYYSAIKRNTFESVLMRWMNLEPIIQSKMSQKEKDKYCILMHIYMESRKMVLKNLFVGQQWRNRHGEQTYGHGERGGEGEMYGESNMETYITICKIDSQWELWYWRRPLRVPWTARRSNQSVLKEISPEYSLEELKLKLQYFGHQM